MHRLSLRTLAVPLLAVAAVSAGWSGDQDPLTGTFDKAACPDYATYAAYPQ
jgi:hypothetical protein